MRYNPFSIHNPFNYFGSDGRIINQILKQLMRMRTDTSIFVEPFGGSGIVSLTVAYIGAFKRVILNDADPLVYAAYYFYKHADENWLRALVKFHEWLTKAKFTAERQQQLERFLIDVAEHDENLLRRGLFAIILIHHSINTRNLKLRHNFYFDGTYYYVYGASKFTARRVFRIASIFRRIEIFNKDAFLLIREFDSPNTVFYIDPPHLKHDAYRLSFTNKDAYRLANLLKTLKGKVLLKLSPEDRIYFHILDDWEREEVKYISQISQYRSEKKYYFLIKR